MKAPNQRAKTKIFRGLVAVLGYGARCGAATSGEFGSDRGDGGRLRREGGKW